MIKIIDNFLPKDVNQNLYNILTGNKFNWHICKEMVHGDEKHWFFYHTGVEDGKMSTPESTYHLLFLPVLNAIEDSRHLSYKYKNNKTQIRCFRAKINCYPLNQNFKYSNWHTDNKNDHIVAIYYVNENNGKTELKNKGIIESKKNRLVLFSGDIEHRAIGHTDTNVRLNYNINYLKQEE